MTTFQELAQQNPQLRQQYQQFVKQQGGGGSSAPNWQAFRQHMQQQGQPDPGQEEPSDLQQAHQQATSQSG